MNELDGHGKPSQRRALKSHLDSVKKTKEQMKVLEDDLAKLDDKWRWYMEWFPNMLDEDVPEGTNELDNVEIKAWSPEKGYLSEKELGKSVNEMTGTPAVQGFYGKNWCDPDPKRKKMKSIAARSVGGKVT